MPRRLQMDSGSDSMGLCRWDLDVFDYSVHILRLRQSFLPRICRMAQPGQ
jgi:hypothetical protein